MRWAEICARCILPRGALGGTTDDVDLLALFTKDSAEAPWQANLLLRLSLWLTWLSPIWMRGRLRTFGSLPAPEREELMEGLLASKIHLVRLTMLYLKLISTSLLMGNERVLSRLGAYGLGAVQSGPAALPVLPSSGAQS